MDYSSLCAHIRQTASYLCVGLDTEPGRLPAGFAKTPEAMLAFNEAIIAATHTYCVAYKINTAFYEALGTAGWECLKQTCQMIPPGKLRILDAKRGDIGNTAQAYARAFFEELGADALTLSPYMGHDSIQPFLEYPGKWVVLLALTSNPGHADFQLLRLANGRYLFEEVLLQAQNWADPSRLMFVVGATQSKWLETVRQLAPDNFLLVPGVGAQGGDLAQVSKLGLNPQGGLLVNASRSILYASSGEDYVEAARQAAQAIQLEMKGQLRAFPA
ncbi:MAG: orotidine-5'-phosphate decarboxylase [Microscillaceae bacterium]|nr:orotidine-5'-phosphate decarboxylase [Microscillaceae bacterium]